MYRKFFCTILITLCCLTGAEAKNKITVSGSIEAYTAYMWRGAKNCGLHMAPSLTLRWGGFALQSYGFFSFDDTYREVDWDLSYSVGDFSFHIGEYYARLSSYTTTENYFRFKKGKTDHILEGIICYEPEKLPFALKWFTFLYGDWIPNADGTPGRPSFSSYLEAEVYHEFTPDNNRLSLLCGASVIKGMFTNYTKDFAVINLELRYRYLLPAGKVKIPLNVSYIINPYMKASWMNAGIGVMF